MHMKYKCETNGKNKRESNTEVKICVTLSFLIFFAIAKSDIEALRLQ